MSHSYKIKLPILLLLIFPYWLQNKFKQHYDYDHMQVHYQLTVMHAVFS